MLFTFSLTTKICPAALTLTILVALAGCSDKPVVYPQPAQVGQDLVVDASPLTENVPTFFSFKSEGKTIRFFVLRTADGVQAFLDACMKCYPKKLGYRFEDSTLYCRACTERFPASEIARGVGSCVPIRIEGGSLVGKDYHIPMASLERMADKF